MAFVPEMSSINLPLHMRMKKQKISVPLFVSALAVDIPQWSLIFQLPDWLDQSLFPLGQILLTKLRTSLISVLISGSRLR
jgi:hypothetical protein